MEELIRTKKQLSVILSKLKKFEDPKWFDEQYSTESNIASSLIWNAFMNNDIKNKIIADYGAGTGILGIGCMILGAKKIIFIEKDNNAIKTLKKNLIIIEKLFNIKIEKENFEIIEENIDNNYKIKRMNTLIDTIIMNPPFGTKIKHMDKIFLESGIKNSNIIYSIHKYTSVSFLKSFSKDNKLNLKIIEIVNFPIKKTMKQHKKEKELIKVILINLNK